MLEQYLQQYFNFSSFRPGQKEIVEAILEGNDVVALMPTGGGKSLCFQLPALMNENVSFVISPLIALMKDQVDSLVARGISATFINSSLQRVESESRLEAIRLGKYKIVYISPERLAQASFLKFLSTLNINLVAVDEAHCVSAWGHDFRPDYLLIKESLSKLPRRPRIAAFTATATPEVQNDIISRLDLQKPAVFVRGFDRPNLKFFVQNYLSSDESFQEAERIIKATPGAAIAYTITRKNAEALALFLREKGISACAYHAGMASEVRNRIQNDFMENRFKVIVATIAFGMGVDKADVRLVLHVGVPSSLEGYYQEAGRAGRDGEGAYCIILPSKKDFSLHYHFVQKSKQDMKSEGKNSDEINYLCAIKFDRLEKMREYVQATNCRRKIILDYFADPVSREYGDVCGNCDVCMNYKWKKYSSSPKKSQRKNHVSEIDHLISDESVGFSGVSQTIMETVRLYKQNYVPEQIAKIRSLGSSTVLGHLTTWYLEGGELEFEKFITKEEEKEILLAMSKADDIQYLSSIKKQLPEEIGYEKIKLVLAKIQRINLD